MSFVLHARCNGVWPFEAFTLEKKDSRNASSTVERLAKRYSESRSSIAMSHLSRSVLSCASIAVSCASFLVFASALCLTASVSVEV